MKNKIIKILSIISCVVIIAVCIFAFPASAAVGDVVWSCKSMDLFFQKDSSFGSDDFTFTVIQPSWATAEVYGANSTVVTKLNNTGLFVGGKLQFPTVDSSAYYRLGLPLTFSDMRNDLRPTQVVINFYNSDNKVVRQIGSSQYSTYVEPVWGIETRTFDLVFVTSGSDLNDFEYIDIFITVENFNATNSYLYFGIYKDFALTITETLSQDTQAIINNQNENTDKILNGGSDNPHYEKPDSSAAQQQDQLTQDIESSTSEGVESANNLFSSFNGLLGGGSHIANGLMAVTAFMNEFLGVPWLSGIITFGLTLGIFSFLLGMGFFISGFARGVKSGEYSLNKEKRAAYRESQRAARSRRY